MATSSSHSFQTNHDIPTLAKTGRRRKILFVITKSNWGGAQRYVYNLATALPREEFDVVVALGGTGYANSDKGELAQKLTAVGIPVCYIRSFSRDVSFYHDMRAFFELASLYQKEQPDIVHLNSSKAGGVGALAARFASWKNKSVIKIIFTSHGLAWDEDRSALARFAIKIFSWITFLLCHDVIVVSKDNREKAQALLFCSKKITLVHNGLPVLQFETRERARVSLALRVGLVEDSNRFWIGVIAELTKNKGLTYLIDAAKLLSDSDKKIRLFIIGSGEEEQNLKNQIMQNKLKHIVHLVGFVSDAYRYNKAFDLVTLTSIKEGLPTVLLEAGLASVPVVATNIAGVRDIVEDGITGLLVEPKNPKNIADALLQISNDPALQKTLSKTLNQKVIKEFSIERMVTETKNLYTKGY